MDAAAGGKPINPLYIPEILKLVLGYVGGAGVNGGLVQLLKARHVSRSWNAQAVKFIEPQTITFTLNEQDSYRGFHLQSFLEHYNQSIPGLVLCLKLEINHRLPPFELLDRHVDRISSFIVETRNRCPITILHLNSLMGLTIAIGTFCKLIRNVSPRLKEFKTCALILPYTGWSFTNQQQQEQLIEQETLSFSTLELPNVEALDLAILQSIPPTIPNSRSLSSIPDVYITILQKCSTSLKSLKLVQQAPISQALQEVIQKLCKLLNETQATLNNLNKLEIRIFNDLDLFGRFCSIHFNNLNTLILHEAYSYHLQPVFLQFLLHKAPCLTNLQILLMYTVVNPFDFEFDQLVTPMPVVSKIKHLALLSDSANPIRLMKNLMIMPQIFINATKFIMDTQTCFDYSKIPSAVIESLQEGGGEYEQCVYPNITSILIKADECRQNFTQEYKSTLSVVYNRVWPNVTTLIIEEVYKDGWVDVIQNGALITFLSLYAGITILELKSRIMGCTNWLTEIFKSNPEIDQLKENLRELILHKAKSLNPSRHVVGDISSFLNNICETFPNLQRLWIEESLLSNYEQLGFEELLDLIEIRIPFPNITFQRL